MSNRRTGTASAAKPTTARGTAKPRDFLSLITEWERTFVGEPVFDLGQAIVREVLRCAQTLQVGMSEKQRADTDLCLNLLMEFLCLHLHLVNRAAFRFGHEFRCKLQDLIVRECFPLFTQALCPINDLAEREQFCDALLHYASETEILYGQKRTIADRDLSEDAVLAVFVSRVAKLLGHPDDPLTMMSAQICVLESMCRPRVGELIERVAKENIQTHA